MNTPKRGCGVCQGRCAQNRHLKNQKDLYAQHVEYDVTEPSHPVPVVLKRAVLAMALVSDFPGRTVAAGSEQYLLFLLGTKRRSTNRMISRLFQRLHGICACTIVCRLKDGTVSSLGPPLITCNAPDGSHRAQKQRESISLVLQFLPRQ